MVSLGEDVSGEDRVVFCSPFSEVRFPVSLSSAIGGVGRVQHPSTSRNATRIKRRLLM